jgi:hypothetical protein
MPTHVQHPPHVVQVAFGGPIRHGGELLAEQLWWRYDREGEVIGVEEAGARSADRRSQGDSIQEVEVQLDLT